MKGILRSVRDWYRIHTRAIAILIVVVIGLGATVGFFVWKSSGTSSPVPGSIKSQAKFTIIYPKGYAIDSSSWAYQTKETTVSFTLPNNGNPIVFTEQAVPLAYKDDAAAYDRFIGSLKPYLSFKVPLGNVSLVGFVTEGDYNPEGRSGILKTNGTLLVAHPEQMIDDAEWYRLFNALVVD